MGRDHRKLEVFILADSLVVEVYRMTRTLPIEERFGLQSQLRRGAVSVPTNLVEGCTRPSQRDYAHFVSIALGSASEVHYLIGLSARLEYVDETRGKELAKQYHRVVRGLQRLMNALSPAGRSP
jgi:four helix bundle protein